MLKVIQGHRKENYVVLQHFMISLLIKSIGTYGGLAREQVESHRVGYILNAHMLFLALDHSITILGRSSCLAVVSGGRESTCCLNATQYRWLDRLLPPTQTL